MGANIQLNGSMTSLNILTHSEFNNRYCPITYIAVELSCSAVNRMNYPSFAYLMAQEETRGHCSEPVCHIKSWAHACVLKMFFFFFYSFFYVPFCPCV